jgi:aryl-alcohol dehydrogenase-like predicted oxidoreductase
MFPTRSAKPGPTQGSTMDTNATTRALGRTGIHVSPLGLAAFSFGGGGGGVPQVGGLRPADVERAFHELGINLFLAHYLMPGVVEGVRRLIRAGHRDEIVLVSEVGIPLAGSVRRGLHKTLRVLGTDRLDVWLYGWVRARWHIRPAVWNAFRRLRDDGLVRAIGFSSHDRLLAARLAKSLDPDILMIRYNAAHRGAEREVFDTLDPDPHKRPGVIAYTATRWGMLMDPLPDQGFPTAMTGPECYRFALGHPAVDTAWCAARSWDELVEDVHGARQGPLPSERLDEIRRFGNAVHDAASGGRRWMFRQGDEG